MDKKMMMKVCAITGAFITIAILEAVMMKKRILKKVVCDCEDDCICLDEETYC